MKKSFSIFFMVIVCFSAMAQDFKLKVWPEGAPDNNGMILPEEVFESKL